MKKITSLICVLFAVLLVAFLPFNNVRTQAFTPLDEILLYEIKVDPNDDATLNITYHVKWKVLDDVQEGPLSWIKIGVANRFVSNIVCRDACVRSATYYDDGGAFVRLDLDRDYHKDEVVEFTFSILQDRIFTLSEDEERIEFAFAPGWFDEIVVDKCVISWKADEIFYCDTAIKDASGEYYVWERDNVPMKTRIQTKVAYSKDYFPNADYNKQYSDEYFNILYVIIPMAAIVLIIVVVAFIAARCNANYGGGYYMYRGYYGTRYMHFWGGTRGVNRKGKQIGGVTNIPGGNGGSGGSHSCACACACACAGGGRAGCSRKDFYSANETKPSDCERIIAALKK